MSMQTNNTASAWWNEALAEFSRALGFEGLTGDTSAVYNFVIGDNEYLLDIECSAEEVVLALFREVALRQAEEKMLSLLRQCHFDNYLPFLVQVGLKDDAILVLAIRLDKSNANQMNNAFDFLCKLYEDAGC